MLRHVEVPWVGARCCAVVTPLSPSHAAACGSALGGESRMRSLRDPLWHSVNCVWRTLAFQVATGRWCGPPVPPPPYTGTHKNSGVCWGSPPLESVTQFAALHDGSVDPFYFRSVVVPTVPLRGLLGGSCIAAHGGSGVFLWPDQHVMIRWPIPCGGGWGELKSSVREFFGLCLGRRPNGAWSQPGRSLADSRP